MKQYTKPLDFAEIGTVFNEVTTDLVGGVNVRNGQQIMRDLNSIQTNLENLLTAHPEQFQGVAAIHAQNIVDQINLEKQAIASLGTDPFAAKYINDVQRDLIDIVQGDDQLAALATQHGASGFAAVPDLLVPPTPFPGSDAQKAFMKQFAADAVDLGNHAVSLANNGFAPTETQQLVQDITAYVTNANAFTVAQGGLYSARFNNEFALDGVNGTASRALIDGLQTGNADEVKAAASVLAANAADVAGNMLADGATPSTGNGIPDHFDTFAQAGAVFNDATTKLIGGVYSGNQQSIHDDLTATRAGLSQLLADHPDQFQGAANKHVQQILSLLDKEIGAVDGTGPGSHSADSINQIHLNIIAIVEGDQALKALATDADNVGFTPLPDGSSHVAHGHDSHPKIDVIAGDHGSGGDHGHGHHHGFEHFWA